MTDPLRSKYRGPAFRAIEEILREDPVLAGYVQTWRSREGQDDDMQPPTYDMMPLLALSPVPNPNTMEAVDLTRINFAVTVELYVPGTRVDDLLGFWEAVEDAIVRTRDFRGTNVGNHLCSVLSPGPSGVIRLWPSSPAFLPVSLDRANPQRTYQWGVGTLSAFILRPA